MAVISTLFPRLPRRDAHLFRELFSAGLLVLVVLAAVRLYTPALFMATAMLPVLYVFYLYEVEAWESNLAAVLVVIFAIGAGLGVGFSLGFGHVVTATVSGTKQGFAFSGILLPAIGQVCMLVGPLLFLARKRSNEAVDGLTFAVVSALGFTFGSVVAEYWHTITAPLVGSSAISTDQIVVILRVAVVAGLVNASTTSAITTSTWLRRHGRANERHDHRALRLPVNVVVAFAFQIGLGLTSYFLGSLLLVSILWAVGAAILLLWMRIIIHNALLREGLTHEVGAPTVCPECHHLVPTMHFCPHCGSSRTAAPKHSRPEVAATL